jgi:hypothetical protein
MRATVALQMSKKTANGFMAGTGMSFPMSIPASVKGWDQISSLADMDPDHAVQLDNWIPRPGYLEIRRGSRSWATGVGSGAVETVMAYNSPNTTFSKLFAVGGGSLYDVTAGGAAVVSTITGLSSNRLQYCNFTNAAVHSWLVAANGVDAPIIYDGSAWAAMTLSGVTVNSIASWTAWKGRLWCTIANSTNVGYLANSAISGAITTFDLGQQMTRGGYITAISTWTQDSKQTVDEYIAFISSRGQVIVYQGTDPATANTFELVGVYDLGAPIGRRCFLRISGNLWIICVDGILPMSEMLTQDRAAAAKVAPTTMIQNAMMNAARLYSGNFGWQFIEYAKGQLAILNIPQTENETAVQYVMNTLTGAWCQFTGLNANCWEVLNDVPYFGGNDGGVYQWDYGSGDYIDTLDYPITATVQTAFNYFDSRGHLKRWTMVRPILTTDGSVTPGVGLNIDFGTDAPISIPSTSSAVSALWDVALWDVAIWPLNSSLVANWTTVEGIGQCCSILTKVSTVANGQANGVTLQLNGWDLIAEPAKGFF